MDIRIQDLRDQTKINEREWNKLTNIICEGCVVPVIGPELLTIAGDDGKTESLYDKWGEALAERFEISVPRECTIPFLYHVANHLSYRQNEMTGTDLAYEMDDIIRKRHWPVPEALKMLVEITSFPLFVTTTIDHLLKQALDEARANSYGGARKIVFMPRGVKTEIDLPEDFQHFQTPAVFHLFGASSPTGGTFARTEDDLIEFSWALLDQQYAPHRLFDYLKQKTILLLGCHFPDWLGRFFIYALKGHRPESAINIYYVSNHLEPGLEEFLRRNRAKVFRVENISDFVRELHRRWQTNRPASSASSTPIASYRPTSIKRGSVFLSYAREDRAVVADIKTQLERANIDTWMDESALEPGAEFHQVIQDNIAGASFFISVISRHLDCPEKPGRYIWKEWKWAEDQNTYRRKDDGFLQPLVIDDTPPGAGFVEPPFRDHKHWTQLKDGLLPQEFIRFLSAGIRRFRREK